MCKIKAEQTASADLALTAAVISESRLCHQGAHQANIVSHAPETVTLSSLHLDTFELLNGRMQDVARLLVLIHNTPYLKTSVCYLIFCNLN